MKEKLVKHIIVNIFMIVLSIYGTVALYFCIQGVTGAGFTNITGPMAISGVVCALIVNIQDAKYYKKEGVLTFKSNKYDGFSKIIFFIAMLVGFVFWSFVKMPFYAIIKLVQIGKDITAINQIKRAGAAAGYSSNINQFAANTDNDEEDANDNMILAIDYAGDFIHDVQNPNFNSAVRVYDEDNPEESLVIYPKYYNIYNKNNNYYLWIFPDHASMHQYSGISREELDKNNKNLQEAMAKLERLNGPLGGEEREKYCQEGKYLLGKIDFDSYSQKFYLDMDSLESFDLVFLYYYNAQNSLIDAVEKGDLKFEFYNVLYNWTVESILYDSNEENIMLRPRILTLNNDKYFVYYYFGSNFDKGCDNKFVAKIMENKTPISIIDTSVMDNENLKTQLFIEWICQVYLEGLQLKNEEEREATIPNIIDALVDILSDKEYLKHFDLLEQHTELLKLLHLDDENAFQEFKARIFDND